MGAAGMLKSPGTVAAARAARRACTPFGIRGGGAAGRGARAGVGRWRAGRCPCLTRSTASARWAAASAPGGAACCGGWRVPSGRDLQAARWRHVTAWRAMQDQLPQTIVPRAGPAPHSRTCQLGACTDSRRQGSPLRPALRRQRRCCRGLPHAGGGQCRGHCVVLLVVGGVCWPGAWELKPSPADGASRAGGFCRAASAGGNARAMRSVPMGTAGSSGGLLHTGRPTP